MRIRVTLPLPTGPLIVQVEFADDVGSAHAREQLVELMVQGCALVSEVSERYYKWPHVRDVGSFFRSPDLEETRPGDPS